MYCLSVLETRGLKSRCGQGHAPPETCRAGIFPSSVQPPLSQTCLCLLRHDPSSHWSSSSRVSSHCPTSVPISAPKCPLYIQTPATLGRAPPDDVMLTALLPLFPHMVPFSITRVRTPAYLLGLHKSPTESTSQSDILAGFSAACGAEILELNR